MKLKGMHFGNAHMCNKCCEWYADYFCSLMVILVWHGAQWYGMLPWGKWCCMILSIQEWTTRTERWHIRNWSSMQKRRKSEKSDSYGAKEDWAWNRSSVSWRTEWVIKSIVQFVTSRTTSMFTWQSRTFLTCTNVKTSLLLAWQSIVIKHLIHILEPT